MSGKRTIAPGRDKSLWGTIFIHAASIVVVACVFGVVILEMESARTAVGDIDAKTQKYLNLRDIDFGDPVDRAILRETLGLFYPGLNGRNDSLLLAIDDLRQRQFSDPALKSGNQLQGLTPEKIGAISIMYLQFLAVYIGVLVVLYFAAQRIGVYSFIKMKQRRESYVAQFLEEFRLFHDLHGRHGRWESLRAMALLLLKAAGKGILLSILFAPAYVIAYAMKTTLDTSSLVFMAALGIISNGVLIQTANRFFTLLVAESHKGYVQTAVVKGLHNSYEWNKPDGIPRRSLLTFRKGPESHIFQHIFLNARFQFIPTLKEHASFLVTGLIIIEMALNIQGHLCYELLQQILFRQYDVACAIVFAIFVTVKGTEVFVDVWHHYERKRYGY